MFRLLPTRLTSMHFFRLLILSAFVIVVAASFWPRGGHAATPASGTVTTANTPTNPLRYTAGPFNVPNVTGFAGALQCNAAMPCDDYALDVDVPAGVLDTHQVRIGMSWPNATADFDYRVYLRNADGTAGAEVLSIGTSADPEQGVLPAVKRNYIVRIVPFAPLGQSVAMAISVEPKSGRFNAATGTAPRYKNYQPTGGLGASAAEPTLGVNWKTGKVMFIADLQTLRVTFNDATNPATATWEDKSFLLTSLNTLDPILYTDRDTGRTIISQLAGTNSLSALTDDDGETWIPNEGGPLTSGVDHQTIGGGPYHAPLTGGTAAYPNAVYYCSQDLLTAFCARSDDGGLTYGPTVPMQILTCGGIHGHVQVAPDGTVYVPHRQCNSNQAVVVSEDNGITWSIRTVADTDTTTATYDSIPGDWDPAVGVGANGTVYFGYENGDGTPHIAVSHDRGKTWVDDQNVGIPHGIRNTAFPTVIAGDDDRAAFAFHGSTDADNTDNGVWHLYVATTYDRGKTWSVVNATPNDPVQRGSVCTEGFGVDACPKGDRNLLDFMDIQVDKQGRVLVGYADGCIGCSSPAGSRSKTATIARQSCGRRLFKQYDPATDDCGGSNDPTPTPTPTPVTEVCDGANIVTDAA
ncbi:MAG TPA: sialidase family protein, partial [Pyrinomonadaceae bacterium]|nr:sialidase family protein [Pyrinomonadaceae bacterium]